MKTFDVYRHPTQGYEAVKSGFSWPAFFFTWIWAFIKGLWGVGLGFIGIMFVFVMIETIILRQAGSVSGALFMFLEFLVFILFGVVGNEWRSNNLKGRGYEHIRTLEAETPDEAIASCSTISASTYTIEEQLERKSSDDIKELTHSIRDFILGLDETIEEIPKKLYVAYKVSQNIVCMEVREKTVQLFLNLKPSDISSEAKNYRDVSVIGHYGTGDVEFTISSLEEFEEIKQYIELAYNKNR